MVRAVGSLDETMSGGKGRETQDRECKGALDILAIHVDPITVQRVKNEAAEKWDARRMHHRLLVRRWCSGTSIYGILSYGGLHTLPHVYLLRTKHPIKRKDSTVEKKKLKNKNKWLIYLTESEWKDK